MFQETIKLVSVQVGSNFLYVGYAYSIVVNPTIQDTSTLLYRLVFSGRDNMFLNFENLLRDLSIPRHIPLHNHN